jgi:hypothetical protein
MKYDLLRGHHRGPIALLLRGSSGRTTETPTASLEDVLWKLVRAGKIHEVVERVRVQVRDELGIYAVERQVLVPIVRSGRVLQGIMIAFAVSMGYAVFRYIVPYEVKCMVGAIFILLFGVVIGVQFMVGLIKDRLRAIQ